MQYDLNFISKALELKFPLYRMPLLFKALIIKYIVKNNLDSSCKNITLTHTYTHTLLIAPTPQNVFTGVLSVR